MLERLQKVLAAAGVASRRDAEALILSGRVQVDGQPVTTLGTKVDPEQATIQVDGRAITARPPALYLALNKPAGYDTTRGDPHAPHTVMELVLPSLESRLGRGHPSVEGLHPVGRLDRETEGLLLLTNDGSFTHALTHPRHGVTKTYQAEVAGRPSAAELARLRAGIEIERKVTAPAEVRLLPGTAQREGSRVEIVIHEGRKRQVRQMLAAVGHPVRHLLRSAIGPVTLGPLKSGQFRMLTPAEVKALREAAERGPEHAEARPASQPPPGPRPGRKGAVPTGSRQHEDRPEPAKKPSGRGPGSRAAAGQGAARPVRPHRGRGPTASEDGGTGRPERSAPKAVPDQKPEAQPAPAGGCFPRGRSGAGSGRPAGRGPVARRDDRHAG
jgi:23S rRNA pseudouridine2605 synthase